MPRPVGPEPDHWRVATSKATHPGPEQRRNTKYVDVNAYDLARAEIEESAIDEVLLFDADGHLVEGGRSNFIVVTEANRLVIPDPQLGAVEGLGLSIVLEDYPEIGLVKLTQDDVAAASELMSINIVRGVVPIVELDGHPIADGESGPWAERIRHIFFR